MSPAARRRPMCESWMKAHAKRAPPRTCLRWSRSAPAWRSPPRRMGEFEWELLEGSADRQASAWPRSPACRPGRCPPTRASRSIAYAHPDDVEALRKEVTEQLEIVQSLRVRVPDDPPGQRQGAVDVQRRCSAEGRGGATRRVIGVVQDITERKSEDGARNALVAELDHRVKNVLASVQSLAAQSARKTTSLDAFLEDLRRPAGGDGIGHTLLTATRWRGAEIGNIAPPSWPASRPARRAGPGRRSCSIPEPPTR